MNELTSTEFRKGYAKLKEPAAVTVNGHVIGWWMPAKMNGKDFVMEAWGEFASPPYSVPKMAQAKRDDLLRKINRSK